MAAARSIVGRLWRVAKHDWIDEGQLLTLEEPQLQAVGLQEAIQVHFVAATAAADSG